MLCRFKRKKIFEYVTGETEAHQAEKIEEHLKSCYKCREYAGSMQKLSDISAAEDQPFLNEVFWRKFDERLDVNLALKQHPASSDARHVEFIPRPLPKFALSFAAAACAVLLFIYLSVSGPFKNTMANFQDELLVETALLLEDNAEVYLNGDEDAYVEEVMLQIALGAA